MALFSVRQGNRDIMWSADRQIGLCGDWLIRPRVEGAFISGTTDSSVSTPRAVLLNTSSYASVETDRPTILQV